MKASPRTLRLILKPLAEGVCSATDPAGELKKIAKTNLTARRSPREGRPAKKYRSKFAPHQALRPRYGKRTTLKQQPDQWPKPWASFHLVTVREALRKREEAAPGRTASVAIKRKP
jgi:hypothetical protein